MTPVSSHSAPQWRGWVPPRELAEQCRGMIPRRVRAMARPCGVRALNARTHGREQVRAEAFERGGPHRRGGHEPSGEADLTRGGVSPRARRPRSRGSLALERGGPRPRGRLAALPWWAVGATTVSIVLCVCVRLEVSLRFAFFCRF
jgi:hypothetical protein